MGNKLESPSAIVQVTTHVPQVEVDPIDLKLSKLEVVRNKKDKPLILSFNSQENNEISRFLAYYVPLHKYKASALIKDQENVVKKCESIEKLSGKTLSDHIQSFFV